MLVALGFGQGPGLALSIGNMWTTMLEGNGATLGVSYAFLGFVFGGTVGVILINLISRKRGFKNLKKPELSRNIWLLMIGLTVFNIVIASAR